MSPTLGIVLALACGAGAASAESIESGSDSVFWLGTFLGRLHPLVVHFPIALLISAAVAEFGSRFVRRRGAVAGSLRSWLGSPDGAEHTGPSDIAFFCLVLGASSAVLAAGLGWLNASSQDFSTGALELVSWHRISGITTAVVACFTTALAWRLRAQSARSAPLNRRVDTLYQGALAAGALAVGVTGHFGGSLVFGDDYLTSALPFARQSTSLVDLPTHEGAVDFVRDVQPIFEASCDECHGPKKQKGQLRLDARHLAIHGGRSGNAIVPGSGEESELISRVLGQGADRRMPLHEDPLSPGDISLLHAWIEQGASWPDAASVADAIIEPHWAYKVPLRVDPPKVKAASWPRNPTDAFILARLEQQGLEPSREADPVTLIRRLFLDLIGLPPSVEEVDAFLADTSADAYEKLVDRLLASPHYGERWASHWLDLARYADSEGFDGDIPRAIWKYRDWVIDAFNQDMPFDRFTIEQIAGDMLPDATEAQRIATGFHRNTMFNREAGVDQAEAYWEILVDRVATTSTVWLGSTLACAQCHDHKFDPFSQREYYEFLAFFGNDAAEWVTFPGIGGEMPLILREPTLYLPTPEAAQEQEKIHRAMAALRAQADTATPELEAAQLEWEQSVLAAEASWTTLVASALASTSRSDLEQLADGSVLVSGINPRSDSYTLEGPAPSAPITALRLDAMTHASLPEGGPGRYADGEFVLTGVSAHLLSSAEGAQPVPLQFTRARADSFRKGHAVDSLISGGDPGPAANPAGWSVGGDGENHRAVFEVGEPVAVEANSLLSVRLDHHRSVIGKLGLGRFRVSLSTVENPDANLEMPASVLRLVAIPRSERSPEQSGEIATYYRSIAPSLDASRVKLEELLVNLDGLNIVSTLVMAEDEPGALPSTVFREGGSYTSEGDTVGAGVPYALHDLPDGRRADRLGLAYWLISKDNPLVARVTVNRIWEQFFGRGIVETTEDFGTQGAEPSHPELLDWLALKFVDLGWSYKAIQRVIVTSATYRQSSVTSPELASADPPNRWLARAPRVRLPAEHIRDVGLASSGLLHPTIGGPSVYPYQLPGVWMFALSSLQWVESAMPDRFRRSLYTFRRRTAPHPSLLVFDAPSREFCTTRRIRTNTPLQALTLLNGSDSFDSARNLGLLLASDSSDVRATAEYGFRRILSRRPLEHELDRIVDYYEQELSYFRERPAEVEEFLETSVLATSDSADADPSSQAAWSMLAASLLNLDEAITKQ